MALNIPALDTPRLRLIAPDESHFDAFYGIYGDAEVMAHLSAPKDRVETWNFIARLLGHWHIRGFGCWAAQEKSSGQIIACVGLSYPIGYAIPEIGWVLGKSSWGKGYASEAAHAVLRFAFDVAGIDRVVARAAPSNLSSIKIAQKLGMVIAPELAEDELVTLVIERQIS